MEIKPVLPLACYRPWSTGDLNKSRSYLMNDETRGDKAESSGREGFSKGGDHQGDAGFFEERTRVGGPIFYAKVIPTGQ